MPDSLTVAEEPDSMIPERIIRHLRKLMPRRKKAILKTSCLLDFVENKAETTRPDSATFTVLCDILRGREPYHWREQVVAAWAIGRAELDEEQQKEAAVATAHLLDYGGKTRGQWNGGAITLGITYAMGWILLNVTLLILYSLICLFFLRGLSGDIGLLLTAPFFVFPFSLLLTPAVPFVTIAVQSNRSNQTREEAACSLGSLGRAEGVPALLRASQNWEFFWTLGRKALARTLPSLKKETHYGTLDSDVVPNLCRLLEKSSDVERNAKSDWQITLLDALEKVGNARSLDTLTHLIKRNTPPQKRVSVSTTDPFDCSPIVLERMVQVREVIVERVARETEAETLLRGSQAPIVPETLLRSYEGTIETPPEQLLRATIKEE
ncbi:MAG: hypothetical protein H7308_05845 [Chthonomonadaceae bacterium]|nr:hypothetical protein [Chthonomonadaceae bacterium]